MGDLIGAYTYKAAAPTSLWYRDMTARIKFGTADAASGLGTGRNDYTLQFLVGRDIGNFTPTFEAGYRVRGKPANLEKGYSESSPDRGVGARLSYYF